MRSNVCRRTAEVIPFIPRTAIFQLIDQGGDGAVEQIAADAVMDRETGQMMFNVTIRTNRSHLGPRPADQPVNPGMQAIVDLHIGKRTILSYLTDRLDRTSRNAFRER